MCPLWPIHYVFMYLAVLGPIWLFSFQIVGAAAQATSKSPSWEVQYEPAKPEAVLVDKMETIGIHLGNYSYYGLHPNDKIYIEYNVSDTEIAYVSPKAKVEIIPDGDGQLSTSFNVTGKFLGYANVCPEINYYSAETNTTSRVVKLNSRIKLENSTYKLSEDGSCIKIPVLRERTAIDKAFTVSVIGLVAIIYINMGAALDMDLVRATLKRPIGPAIGFMSQFIIMPLLAYVLCKTLITRPDMQLGLFITGCSPGGGASNIWTLMLGGNLDLSITMTTISSISAFAMMPLWIFTLGRSVVEEANLKVPWQKIAMFVTLLVPLIIGIIIRRFSEKVANKLVKILKPFAIFLIIFIVVFAVYTNLYLFKLFTTQILLAGFLLPLLGYILGGGVALLLKQKWRDVIAIGIETGVQNTGLAIMALKVCLDQPEADLTTALPVAVAIMTPILPTLLIVYQKIRGEKLGEEEQRKDPLVPLKENELEQGHSLPPRM